MGIWTRISDYCGSKTTMDASDRYNAGWKKRQRRELAARCWGQSFRRLICMNNTEHHL
jgi:hypothetical protein